MANYEQMPLINDLERTIFPEACLGCDVKLLRNEQLICSNCLLNLPATLWHLNPENKIYTILKTRFQVTSAFSFLFFNHSSVVQNLMHALKYRKFPEIGIRLGVLFGEQLFSSQALGDIDALMPVPLHEKKRAIRGYNQSEMIVKGMASALPIVADLENLKRIKHSESQTKKNRIERWLYMQETFHCQTFSHKHVLLVDDVVTTGSTLEACANAISAANPNCKISVATLAFAD